MEKDLGSDEDEAEDDELVNCAKEKEGVCVPKNGNKKNMKKCTDKIQCQCNEKGCLTEATPFLKLRDGSSQSTEFCFIDGIKDPGKPKENCYDDVEFLPSKGKFFSFKACAKTTSTTPASSSPNPSKVNLTEATAKKKPLPPIRKFWKHLENLFERK